MDIWTVEQRELSLYSSRPGGVAAAAGSVSRHLPSLHVDPGICRLVRWLSHVWLLSPIPALQEEHLNVSPNLIEQEVFQRTLHIYS